MSHVRASGAARRELWSDLECPHRHRLGSLCIMAFTHSALSFFIFEIPRILQGNARVLSRGSCVVCALADGSARRCGGNDENARYGVLKEEVESFQALRKATGTAQGDIASALCIGQPSASKIERQADIYLSTLRNYVAAAGAIWNWPCAFQSSSPFICAGWARCSRRRRLRKMRRNSCTETETDLNEAGLGPSSLLTENLSGMLPSCFPRTARQNHSAQQGPIIF
jgi:hypothetical protein